MFLTLGGPLNKKAHLSLSGSSVVTVLLVWPAANLVAPVEVSDQPAKSEDMELSRLIPSFVASNPNKVTFLFIITRHLCYSIYHDAAGNQLLQSHQMRVRLCASSSLF